VQVDGDERIPSLEHVVHEAARLRRLEFHVVAVEVEALRVLANAFAGGRADLRLAMLGRDALVAVGVVDRGDEDDHPVAQLAMRRDQVAQQHQRGFFAFDFAGVNVGHDEDDRQLRRSRNVRPQDDQRQRAAFVRRGEVFDANVGIDFLDGADERDHVVIARRRPVVGSFGKRRRCGTSHEQ
jgi:hypothetical protein